MKISKDRLKELVQEELSISLGSVGDVGPDMLGGEAPHVESDGEGYMAKQNLWKIAEYASKLYELMGDNDNLEPWVEEKIAIAAFIMDSVGHYIEYAKHREHEAGEGEMDHFEVPHEENHEEDDMEVYDFDPEAGVEAGGGEDEYEEEYEDEDEEERH